MKPHALLSGKALFLMLVIHVSFGAHAQQDAGGAQPLWQVSGQAQLWLRWNAISGLSPRVQPFAGQAQAALIVKLLGVEGPFTAAFSEGNLSYRLPAYAFYGFSPRYKWAQLHLGDRSLSFSPYALDGHNFKGAGLELRPGKFYFAAMQGRLQRAAAADAGAIQNIEPRYRRWGQGFKAAYDNGDNQLGLVLFHARDDAEQGPPPDSGLLLRPQENLVLELQGKKRLGDRLGLAFDLAHSAHTRDLAAPLISEAGPGFNGRMLGLFAPRQSTGYSQAWRLALDFNPGWARFSLAAERIGAGYQSLGRLAFLNDTENVQLGATAPMLSQKLSLSATVGLQRNGLQRNGLRRSSVGASGLRAIGSLNLSARLSDRTAATLALSNVNYTLRQRIATTPFLVVDSIVIVQSNWSAQLAASRLLGPQRAATAALAVSLQGAAALSEAGPEMPGARHAFYSAIASYAWRPPDGPWEASAALVASIADAGLGRTALLSASAQAQRQLPKLPISLSASAAYTRVRSRPARPANISEARLGAQWTPADKHRFEAQLAYVRNGASALAGRPIGAFSDFNGQLGYLFRF